MTLQNFPKIQSKREKILFHGLCKYYTKLSDNFIRQSSLQGQFLVNSQNLTVDETTQSIICPGTFSSIF